MNDQTRRRQRRKVLTDTMIAALPRKPVAYFHADPELPKHGVRVRPSGPGTFTVIARDPFKKQRWIKVGSTAETKIAEARDVARSVIKRVEAGLAPFEAPPVQPDTVADVVENFLKRHVEKNRMRTADEVRRVLKTYVLPRWADRPFADIKRSDIAALLDAIEDAHGAWVADAVLAQLRSVATWFASRNDDYQLPFVRGMRRVDKRERARARILSDDELRSVWRAAEGAGVYGGMVRLLLLSAQRRDKVVGMLWSSISPDGTWTIPTAAREKGNAGVLKLPEAALAIIRSMPRLVSNAHVFAGAGGGATANFSQNKVRVDAASGVSGWTLHDLRRTSRSLLSRAGVRPDIAERVLGHAIRGVEGVYDRHPYDTEKADALARLAALIERIIYPPEGNVVPMHEAAAS
jgi:integrase